MKEMNYSIKCETPISFKYGIIFTNKGMTEIKVGNKERFDADINSTDLEDVNLYIDNIGIIHIMAKKLVWDLNWNEIYDEDEIELYEEQYIETDTICSWFYKIFMPYKNKTVKYVREGWAVFKQRDPFELHSNNFNIEVVE